jgi:sigma-B regulation protein RsbU (phosphoserine phosphatase)
MRNRLPGAFTDRHLVFRGYAGDLTVFVDATPVYVFRDPSQDGRVALHDVELPPAAAGRRLYIRVPHAHREALLGSAPFLVSDARLPVMLENAASDPLRRDARDILIALGLMLGGVAAAAAAMLRRRGDSRALLWFGAFTFLYGLRLAVKSYLPILFGVPLRPINFAEAFITYVITIPAWALTARLLGRGWKSTLRAQVVVFAIFAPIGIAADLLTHRPASLEFVNNILVVIGGAVVLVNTIRLRGRSTLEQRVVLGGALLFLLFALNNNLAALGVLPWSSGDETLGFLIFVASLGFASVRGFLRGEREQIALENELRTAREIQQSILPTSMPDVPGLRFQARYDPASSVAGDLYDFLRVDEAHVGVLVADVSGHGVPAALIASMVKIAVTSQSRLAGDPAAMLHELDRTLRREVKRAFVTATYLWLDMAQRTVTVTNAGHPPPLLFRAGTFTDLGARCVLLGRFNDARFTASTTELAAGDRIVAYTDGLVEARNPRGEQFGEERLQELVRRGADVDEIVNAVRAWRAADEDADDLTIVTIDVA